MEPAALAALVGLVAAKRVSVGAGRQVLDRLVADGGDPLAIVEAEGLAALDGGDELARDRGGRARRQRRRRRARARGNAKAIGPIVGHVMRETKGRADGGEVTRLVTRAARHLSGAQRPRRDGLVQAACRAHAVRRPSTVSSEQARGRHFGLRAKGKAPGARQYARHEQASSKLLRVLLPAVPPAAARRQWMVLPAGPGSVATSLASVGRRPGLNGVDLATARIARELGRLGRS